MPKMEERSTGVFSNVTKALADSVDVNQLTNRKELVKTVVDMLEAIFIGTGRPLPDANKDLNL